MLERALAPFPVFFLGGGISPQPTSATRRGHHQQDGLGPWLAISSNSVARHTLW